MTGDAGDRDGAGKPPASPGAKPGDDARDGESDPEASSKSDQAFDALLAQLADAPEEAVDPAPPRRLEPGSHVARYQIVRELGRGGFGVVYEARDGELGRHVALKALRPDRIGRSGKREKSGQTQRELRLSLLQQEAETVARLQHPNIVTLYDLVLQDGLPYLVLELLSGETLQAALARGPVSPGEAIEIGIQIARGLAHAHAAGVIHRDLKPSNVFRTHDGLVKLLDLGLAKGLRGDSLLPRAGTPGFMAPEQWRGAEDARSDVYGAGLLLHALLGGKVPHAFSGTGSHSRSELPASGARPHEHTAPVLDIPALAPPALAQLIERSCAADPALRPQSARALLDELLAFQRGTTPSSPLFSFSPEEQARISGPQTPLSPLSPQLGATTAPQPQQHRSLRIAVLVLGLFVLCFVPWMITRHASVRLGLPAEPKPPPPEALPAQELETFRETGPLLWPRAGAATILLRTGLVLVVGGADESGPSAAAELFDPLARSQPGAGPLSGAFRPTAALGVARRNATATLLGDGRALIAGGEGRTGTVAQLELYEPSGNRGRGAFWSGPLLHTARSGQCAVALGDGRILIAGGEKDGAPLADAELFDPHLVSSDGSRGNLLPPIPLLAARTHPACALLPDGRVLIAGGISPSGAPLASAEIFDPDGAEGRGSFSATGALATARAFAAAIRVEDGRVFLAGGLGPEEISARKTREKLRALPSVERFDPLANSGRGAFVAAQPLLSPRSSPAAVALAAGSILIAGGTGDNENRLASAELYSPDATPAARPTMNLSTPRGGPAAALLADGRVLVAGGDQRPGRAVSSAELFLPRGLSHTALAVSTGPLHEARSFPTAAQLADGSLIIAGGRSGTTLDSIERFDPRAAAFSEAGHLRFARTGASSVLLADGEALVAGGVDGTGTSLSSAELISMHEGQARSALTGPLVTARAFAAMVRLPDGRALIAGGAGVASVMKNVAPGASGNTSANGAAGGATNAAAGNESDGGALAAAELFDPRGHGAAATGRRGEFVATGELGIPRREPMIALLPDGRALIAGGLAASGVALASAEIFDPLANSGRGAFLPTGPMAQGRARAAIALLPTGKVLVAGGFGQAALASAELFDPLADGGRGAFQPTGGLLLPRQRSCAQLLANGAVLVVGGADAEGGALASAELFEQQGDDGIGTFAPAAGLAVGRELPLCARLPSGGILIAGGRNNGLLGSAEIWKAE